MDREWVDKLAGRAARGDREAFRRLVEGEARRLLAVAYRYCGDWDTAADLCQDTWLRVHASFDDYDPARPFRPWLNTLHRRICLQHLRRASVRRASMLSVPISSRLSRAPASFASETELPTSTSSRSSFRSRLNR